MQVSDKIDLLADPDKLRSLSVARLWVPHDGKAISTATMFRWAQRGVHGVKLQVLRSPRGTFTSRAAINEFLTAVDAVRSGTANAVDDATEDQLRDAGLIR